MVFPFDYRATTRATTWGAISRSAMAMWLSFRNAACLSRSGDVHGSAEPPGGLEPVSWLLQVAACGRLRVSAPALAADWSLKFGSLAIAHLDDNLDLEEIDRDAGLISSTAFNLDLLALGENLQD